MNGMQSPGSGFGFGLRVQLAVVLTLAFLAYLPAFWGYWYFDDFYAVVANPQVQSLSIFKEIIANFTHRSLVNLTYALDWELTKHFNWFVTRAKPNATVFPSAFVFHVSSVVYHLIATGMVFVLARKMCRLSSQTTALNPKKITSPNSSFTPSGQKSQNVSQPGALPLVKLWNPFGVKNDCDNSIYSWIPFLTAMLFGIHPIHTDAVTYVSGRSSVLATMEYLGGIYLFLIGLERLGFWSPEPLWRPSRRWRTGLLAMAGALLCFVAGVGTKPTVVTMFLMGVAIYAFLAPASVERRVRRRRVGGMALVLFVPLALFVLQRMESMSQLNEYKIQTFHSIWDRAMWLMVGGNDVLIRPWWVNLLSQTAVIGLYYFPRQLGVLPMNIDPDLPEILSLLHPRFLGGLCVIVTLLAAMILSAKRRPLIAIGIAWYFITLLPTSSLIPLFDLASERHVYLANFGFLLALSAALLEWIDGKRRWRLYTGAGLAGIFICLFFTSTLFRNGLYAKPTEFWEDAVKHSPGKARVHVHLGTIYWENGRPAEALEAYKKALALQPYLKDTAVNVGILFLKEFNDPNSAAYMFRECVKLWPAWKIPRNNLGACYLMSKQFDEALRLGDEWLAKQPGSLDAKLLMANARMLKGELDAAEEVYRQILAQHGEVPAALDNLVKISGLKGHAEQAQTYQKRAETAKASAPLDPWQVLNPYESIVIQP